MSPLKIFFCDLTYDTIILVSDTIPINIGFIASYAKKKFENEISVSELASYLHEHHDIKGVLFNQTDYLLADEKQRFIYNSLHEKRFLVTQDESGFAFSPVKDEGFSNHLSCHTDIADTSVDIIELTELLNKQ